MRQRRFLNSQEGLVELLAFIAVNHHADDMTRVVDAGVRNRREIQVATLNIGTVHLIKPLSDFRGGKDTIVPEAVWPVRY